MTTIEGIEGLGAESTPEGNSGYAIDPARARELNRSLNVTLLGLRCPSCKSRLEANGESPSNEEHMKDIAECCATQDGFIRVEMPMQEIIFRTLLAESNRPISLNELHYLVTERWHTPSNPRSISVNGLKRVLDSDVYYGFREVSPGQVEE
jgi:hypothetical protein